MKIYFSGKKLSAIGGGCLQKVLLGKKSEPAVFALFLHFANEDKQKREILDLGAWYQNQACHELLHKREAALYDLAGELTLRLDNLGGEYGFLLTYGEYVIINPGNCCEAVVSCREFGRHILLPIGLDDYIKVIKVEAGSGIWLLPRRMTSLLMQHGLDACLDCMQIKSETNMDNRLRELVEIITRSVQNPQGIITGLCFKD